MSKVFIGVGHGGKDPGAVSNGIREEDVNLDIAKACAENLRRHGVTVKLSRTADENDPVSDEVKECNAFSPDLAVDVHTNAGGGEGFEAYYHCKGGKSKTLAENIEKYVVEMGRKSRGIKTKVSSSGKDYFAFIRETKSPAVIAECAFIDSRDAKHIDTKAEREAYGEAYAKGILKTLGISWKSESEVYTVKQGDSLWKIAAEKLKNGARWDEIRKMNGLKGTAIRIGQKLKIPKK